VKKKDEILLWNVLWDRIESGDKHPMIGSIGKELGINEKRVAFIAEKWDKKRLIDCGISARTGWINVGITRESLK
jgi:soluble P-type ATPase